MKLFNRKPNEDVFAKLDKLMMSMADTKTYLEYVGLRGGMQLKILILIILLLVLFGVATTDGIGKGDADDNGL